MTAGAFETHSKKAYFNVTLPEKAGRGAYCGAHGAVQRGTIVSTSVHEAFRALRAVLVDAAVPQHHSQGAGANTNIEAGRTTASR